MFEQQVDLGPVAKVLSDLRENVSGRGRSSDVNDYGNGGGAGVAERYQERRAADRAGSERATWASEAKGGGEPKAPAPAGDANSLVGESGIKGGGGDEGGNWHYECRGCEGGLFHDFAKYTGAQYRGVQGNR